MDEELAYEIRFAAQEEWEEAMGLAWKTFLEFEADVYTMEGVRSFEDFITDSGLKRMFIMGIYQMMTAYDHGRMVGMITLRNAYIPSFCGQKLSQARHRQGADHEDG